MRFPALFPVLVLAAAAFSASAASDPRPSVRWQPFEQAAKAAAGGGKYMFVSVYTDWCGYCRQLEATTLRAEAVVAELGRNFVSVKLNAESDEAVAWKGEKMTARDLATTWGVVGYPTLIFLNAKSEVIGSFASYAEPKLMMQLLTYISSGARERKVSFEDFIKRAG